MRDERTPKDVCGEATLVEEKFNSFTLAALSFNAAKDLLVFSTSPLFRSN